MVVHRDKLAEAVIEHEKALRAARSELEALWQRIGRYVIPRRASFTEEISAGVERSRFVLDSTAPRSLELFASFLHSLMNNPSTQWFKIRALGETKVNEDAEARKWFEDEQKAMLAMMSTEAANLYTHLYQVHLDLGAFGTGVLYDDVIGGAFRARAFHLGDVVFDEDANGFVDLLHRQFKYTARQARQRWPGVPLGDTIDRMRGPRAATEKTVYLHSVFPTNHRDLGPLVPRAVVARGSPFVSVWVNVTDKKVIVKPGTYEEFPYQVPRWYRVRQDVYGRSPAMTVLPSIQMVNRMKETILRGAEKLVDPPLLLPDGGLVSPIRLYPGGLSFSEGNVKPEALIPPGASRIEVGNELLAKEQQDIKEGFFVPLFIGAETPVKTATQVLQERDQRNLAVSPMLVNVQAELYHPFIKRVFNIRKRNGLQADLPDVLRDVEIEIEYVSPLVAARKEAEGLSVLRLFESVAPWNDVDPGAFDQFDVDQIGKILHGASGAPASIIRNATKIKQLRDARLKKNEAEAAQAQAFGGGQVLAKLIAAQNKGGGT